MAESSRDEIAKLESMYAANPEGRVFTHLAEAYRRAGELSRAREVLEEGLRRHQDSASGYVVLGRVLQDTGEPRQATDAFGRVLELDPENRVALRALGDLARAAGEPKQALTYFEQLRTLDPSDELDGLIAEIGAAIPPEAVAPVAEVPSEPVSPYAMPQEPPRFTPADFPQDLTSLDLSGFSSATGSAQPDAGGRSPWGAPAAEAGPSGPEEPPPLSLEAGPVQAGGTFSEMPSTGDFGFPGGDMPPQQPSAEDVPPVEGLVTVERVEVAPLEGLEPADEQGGAFPPLRDYGAVGAGDTAFPGMGSGFDMEAGDDLAEAPFGQPASAEMVTETMAELYRSQGHLVQAAEVYRALLRDRPGDEQLERKLLEIELAILSPEPAGTPVDETGGEDAPWLDESVAEAAPAAPQTFAGLPADEASEPGWGAQEVTAGEEPAPSESEEAQPVAEAPAEGGWAGAEAGDQWMDAQEGTEQEWVTPEAGAQEEWAAAEPVDQVDQVDQDQWTPPEPVPQEELLGQPSELLAEGAPEPAGPAPWEAPAEGLLPPAPETPAWEAPDGAAAGEPPAWEVPTVEAESAEPDAEAPAWEAPAGEAGGETHAAEAPVAEAEAAEAAIPAMEQVWGAGGDVAASPATPYAWESGPAEEAKGPPVSGYLRALLAWHRSVNGTPAATEADSAATESTGGAEPWADQAQAPPAESSEAAGRPTWADEAAGPGEPTRAEEAAAPAEPTWADEAAAPDREPWAEEAAAPAWEEPAAAMPEPAPAAPETPAAPGGDLAWLTGPDGIAPEHPEGDAQVSPQEAPGDDDDLEMFRAWLQSLKK